MANSMAGNTMNVDRWRERIRQDALSGYHYEMARAIEREGNIVAALEHIERAIGVRSDMAAAHLKAIALLKTLGDDERTAAAERRALAVNPDYVVDGHLEMAARLEEQGDYDDELAVLRRGLEATPGAAALRRGEGRALRLLGRVDEAVAVLDETARENADDPVLLTELGIARRLANDTLGALDALRRATSLDSDNMEAWEALGRLLLSRGEDAEAEKAFRVVLVRDPFKVDLKLGLASSLDSLGRSEEAVAILETVPTGNENDTRASWALGWIKFGMGRYEEAKSLFDRCRATPGARAAMGMIALCENRVEEGVRELAADATERNTPSARSELSVGLMSSGRQDEALALVAEAHRSSPSSALVITDYVALHWRAERREEARTVLGAALAKGIKAHRLLADARWRPAWVRPAVEDALASVGDEMPRPQELGDAR